VAAANPLVERSEALWQEAWTAVQDAKRAVSTFTDAQGKQRVRGRDFSAMAQTINSAVRSLELLGRSCGLLREDPADVHIENMMVVLPRVGAGPREVAQPSPDGPSLDVTAKEA
jgi:hypothetical protein